MTEKNVSEFFRSSYKDGTIKSLADRYGIKSALLEFEEK